MGKNYQAIDEILLDPRFASTALKIVCGDTGKFLGAIYCEGKPIIRVDGDDVEQVLDKLISFCEAIQNG